LYGKDLHFPFEEKVHDFPQPVLDREPEVFVPPGEGKLYGEIYSLEVLL